jgi:ubiquinone/menaquinone biosynthesis C-methylase UbiE
VRNPIRSNPFEAPGVARAYDAWFETPLGAHADRVEKALIRRLARPRAGERALDVGTGTGHYAAWLADLGLQVSAVDSSPAMLEVARARRHPVAWRQATADALPFDDGAFDLVLSVTMLEFVDRPAEAVDEMFRVVRPGGRLVAAVLNRDSPWARAREAEARELDTPFRYAHFYSPGELAALLGRHGPVTWGGALFVGPQGQGLAAASRPDRRPWLASTRRPSLAAGMLLECLGAALFRRRGALLAARVGKPPAAAQGGER